jgi:hypothetical protein
MCELAEIKEWCGEKIVFKITIDDSKVDCNNPMPVIRGDCYMMRCCEKQPGRFRLFAKQRYKAFALDLVPSGETIDTPICCDSLSKYGSLICLSEFFWKLSIRKYKERS